MNKKQKNVNRKYRKLHSRKEWSPLRHELEDLGHAINLAWHWDIENNEVMLDGSITYAHELMNDINSQIEYFRTHYDTFDAEEAKALWRMYWALAKGAVRRNSASEMVVWNDDWAGLTTQSIITALNNLPLNSDKISIYCHMLYGKEVPMWNWTTHRWE